MTCTRCCCRSRAGSSGCLAGSSARYSLAGCGACRVGRGCGAVGARSAALRSGQRAQSQGNVRLVRDKITIGSNNYRVVYQKSR